MSRARVRVLSVICAEIRITPLWWEAMTIQSNTPFGPPQLWRHTYPENERVDWKALIASFQKRIYCPYGTRSLPFQKNQDFSQNNFRKLQQTAKKKKERTQTATLAQACVHMHTRHKRACYKSRC